MKEIIMKVEVEDYPDIIQQLKDWFWNNNIAIDNFQILLDGEKVDTSKGVIE